MATPYEPRATRPEPTRTDEVPYPTHGAARGEGPHNGRARGPEAIEPLLEHLAQLREQAAIYAATKVDRLRLRVTRWVFLATAGLLALIVLLSVLFAAALALVAGLSLGLAEATGGRLWLGALLAALILLATLALGVWIGWRIWMAVTLRQLKRRYARRSAAATRP